MDEDEYDRVSKGNKAVYRLFRANFKTGVENGYFYGFRLSESTSLETVGAQVNLILCFVLGSVVD